MRTAFFWVIAQRVLIISYRGFGTTYHSHLRRSSLKMGMIGCPETPVRNYLFSLRNNPEERNSQIFLCSVLSKFLSFKADQWLQLQFLRHECCNAPFAVMNRVNNCKCYTFVLIIVQRVQHKAICLLFCKFTLHVSGVNHTYHQEYTKLWLQPPVIVSYLPPTWLS